MKAYFPLIISAAACLSLTAPCVLAADPAESAWTLKPRESPVRLNGFMGSLDLSGLAKFGNQVVVVSDELTGIQVGTFNEDARTIGYTSAISLASGEDAPKKSGKKKDGGKKKEGKATEIDIEGACYAADEKAFYVTGSHGVGKKKGDVQMLRYGVYRIPFDGEKGGVLPTGVAKSTLLPILETSPQFKDHVRQPLQQNGFNVEGLAYAQGRLYFGVRGPNIEGSAFIIEVGAKEFFAGSGIGVEPKVHAVPVGAGKGIRELVSVNGGFLMITGNAAAEASKDFPDTLAREDDAGFMLSFLPSSGPGNIGKPETIGDVSAPDGKAEGLLVLKDADGTMDIVVLHDGLEQGGATEFTVRRPAKQVASAEK